MIELYLKTNEVKKLDLISEIDIDAKDLFNIRIIDFTDSELQKFLKIWNRYVYFNQRKDIEISSHYLKSNGQLSFNFQYPIIIRIPFFKEEIFIIIKKKEWSFLFFILRDR
jgi:magnesium transporter